MSRKRTIELIATVALVTAATVAAASETITYTYDAKGRLVLITHAGNVNNNVIANYTMDRADNRTNVKVTGAP